MLYCHVQATPLASPDPQPNPVAKKPAPPPVQPVLEKLFEFYPLLFGAQFLPLKLGIYHELLALHPEHFQRDTLKAALGVHTRSTRYLQCVAAGKARHDLQGVAGDPVAPEHIYLAILELHRRRQMRSKEDLSAQLHKQIKAAFEVSGLSGSDYLARLLIAHDDAHPVLQEAIAEQSQKLARQEALFKAFEASGKSPEEFADMYGTALRDVTSAIEGHRRLQPTA
jgi:ProP effector